MRTIVKKHLKIPGWLTRGTAIIEKERNNVRIRLRNDKVIHTVTQESAQL